MLYGSNFQKSNRFTVCISMTANSLDGKMHKFAFSPTVDAPDGNQTNELKQFVIVLSLRNCTNW